MINLQEVTNQIVESIGIIVRASMDPNQMKQAHMILEAAGSNLDGPTSLEVANKLITFDADKELIQSVRHFGLQLVENCIKFKWSDLPQETQSQVKSALENMIHVPDDNTMRDSRLFREGLSRCVVEAMKKEWPQQWPKLFPLMMESRHNEKVLLILGRLSEELGIFFSPPNRDRRRDMNFELRNNYKSILEYILECLTNHNMDLCAPALKTLNPFLEWFPCDSELSPLFTILCFLLSMDLNDSNFIKTKIYIKQLVGDNLLTCLFRKGPKKERSELVNCLFSEPNFNFILNSVVTALPHLSDANLFSEVFDLLKRFFLIISMMGQIALSLHSFQPLQPNVWETYLAKMQWLFSVDNTILNAFILQFWRELVRYKDLLPTLLNEQRLKEILELIPGKLVKKPFNSESMGYEFDDNEAYDAFFYKFRAELLELVRSFTLYQSDICFFFVMRIMNQMIESNSNSSMEKEWEVVAILLEAVCNKISKMEPFIANQGAQLLSRTISQCNTFNNMDIVSSQLSCISALSIFLPFAIQNEPNIMDCLLQRIFFLASFDNHGENKFNRSKQVRDIRRHSGAFFIKLTRTQTPVFFPIFDQLRRSIKELHVKHPEFTQTEICLLNEGLLILSNSFDDISKQRSFIQELVQPIEWFAQAHMTVDGLINFLGLNLTPSNDDSRAIDRGRLSLVISTITGLLNRVTRKEAILMYLTPFFLPLCNLTSVLNSLWRPEKQAICHPHYRQAVFAHLTDSEKAILLDPVLCSTNSSSSVNVGKEDHSTSKTPVSRMVIFLEHLYEQCFVTIGEICKAFKPEIFIEFKNFSMMLVDLECLPELKLKSIAKGFIRPFISNFPKDDLNLMNSKFLPVIKEFLPVFFYRINAKCKLIQERQSAAQENEDKAQLESEILEEKLCRLLSLEFLEILSSLLLKPRRSRRASKQAGHVNEADWVMDDADDRSSSPSTIDSISDVGDYLIRAVPNIIVSMNFEALTWLESDISYKASQLCQLVLEKLIAEDMIKNENAVEFFLGYLLKALNHFGEYEVNESIYLNCIHLIYETVIVKLDHKSLSSLRHKLAEASQCDIQKWIDYETNFIPRTPITGPPEKTSASRIKAKKEALRHLLDPVIGKSKSSLFKKPVKYEGPKFPFLKRLQKPNIFSQETLDLCNLFLSKG